ncbi:hypothetical protein DHX103_12135 [Planococcus sp. X10-3]|uniref:hypothetical protein n=1 Tax=Planococcus sp. X10-3 TaxID=3061240 RepID=UPI003BB1EA9A
MKKLSMILLALLLAFGFSSTAMASKGHVPDTDSKETVSFHKGVTTIVTTKKDVSYDKKVEVKKSTEYFTEKKSKKSSEKKVVVEVKKEKHPKKDLYRNVEIATTYKIITTTKWDEVTRVDTIKKFITPVKTTKTTVTTLKKRGAPHSNGKVISKDVKTYEDKEYGETVKKVETKKHVSKKNEKTTVNKKVIKVEKTYGKWMKKHGKH